MSNTIDFPDGNLTKNNYESSGNDGHTTASIVFKSVNAGRRQLLTYNREILSC